MCIVKKTPKASFLVIYYAKLTRIFWISSSHIYHAFSWLKLFTLQKSFNKNLTQKDLQLIASSVVLAALSVPPYDRSHGASHMELENQKERNLRVANLIGFIVDPRSETREVVTLIIGLIVPMFFFKLNHKNDQKWEVHITRRLHLQHLSQNDHLFCEIMFANSHNYFL